MSGVIVPSESEIREAAYFNWKRRGCVHGYHDIDWHLGEQAVFLDRNYVVLENHSLWDATKKTRFGTRNPRRCRFCGGTPPGHTFGKVAHAIPEMLGNKALFSDDECDACNQKFSQFESHLANFLAFSRAATNVRGKKGTQKFVTNNQKARLVVKDNHIEARGDVLGEGLAHIAPDGGKATLSAESQTFTPLAVYKCFTKMALSIMPETELRHFQNAIEWISKTDHCWLAENFAWLTCYHYFVPGLLDQRYGYVLLLKRRHRNAELPYMLFFVAFTNQAFQIMLPCCPLDNHLIGNEVAIPPIPHGRDFLPEFGLPIRQTLPLGNSEPTRIQVNAQLTKMEGVP